jgi:hypothetical protein
MPNDRRGGAGDDTTTVEVSRELMIEVKTILTAYPEYRNARQVLDDFALPALAAKADAGRAKVRTRKKAAK